ncbi:MAG: extracellular solute-binding protein [Lachnospiraceae bacterium]|nr:extracellular solute-binding protein [Lachnospiraceae bacterium]
MRNTKRWMACMLAAAIAGGTLAGCGGEKADTAADTTAQTSETKAGGEAAPAEKELTVEEEIAQDMAAEPIVLEYRQGGTTAEIDDDAEVVKYIEEKFNIDLKSWYVDSKNYWENVNVRFAGGEMPDVLRIDNASQLGTLVEGGIIAEIPIETIRKYAPNYAKAMDDADDGSYWTTLLYNGKNYGMPIPQEVTPHAMIWRKDWLDKLGLEVPTTLEEYEKVLTAFVEQDPDGNGKKDTAGMAERAMGAIFGAYGVRCVTGLDTKAQFFTEEMQLGEDNVPFFPYIRPEAKEGLALLHDWYEKGIIDKEFITGENHGGYGGLSHSFMNGQIGLTTAQPYHYLVASTDSTDETNWGICMKEFKALNPDADIVYGPAPIGPNGKSGTEAWGKLGVFTCITTKAAQDPRKVRTILRVVDEYFKDTEYIKMVNYGIKDVHYSEEDGVLKRIMDGTELRKQGILQVDLGNTPKYANEINKKKTEFGNSVTGNGYYRFNVPPVEEFSNSIATLDTMTEQAYFDIISGAKPVDYFDTFVEEFKAAGGEAAEQAVQAEYAARLEAVKQQ